MKHELTDAQIAQLINEAATGKEILVTDAHGDVTSTEISYVRAILQHQPEPTAQQDDWQECEFDDILPTDQRIKGDFGGYSVEGPPIQKFPGIPAWEVGDTHVGGSKHTIHYHAKATYYRLQAKIVHPHPADHPVIFVRGYIDLEKNLDGTVEFEKPVAYFWDGDKYDAPFNPLLEPEEIVDWWKAAVVAAGDDRG